MTLDEVKYQKGFDSHTNDNRTVISLLEDSPEWLPQQVKVAKLERDAEVSNHWREFAELYGIIGEARFLLEDIETKKRQTYLLTTGDRLLVPARIALQIKAPTGAIIIACCAERDDGTKSHKYVFD